MTVNVSDSPPSGLVPAASNPATFTVSDSMLVLGGTSSTNGLFGRSLSDVASGDLVAGGLVGRAGETLSEVESTPLQVLIDFPSSSTTTTGTTTTTTTTTSASDATAETRTRALGQALALFGVKSTAKGAGKTAKQTGESRSHKHVKK